MAKRTKRRNVRYSHKRNSKKKRVSKKRRRVSRRRVSNKTYKHKNMRGGAGRGHSNAGMTDEEALEAAIRASQGEADAGKPESGSGIIYNILRKNNLLEYYSKILEAGYDDSTIGADGFLDDLGDDLKDIIPEGKLGHRHRIIGEFRNYKEENARVAGGPAPVSGFGAPPYQPAVAAPAGSGAYAPGYQPPPAAALRPAPAWPTPVATAWPTPVATAWPTPVATAWPTPVAPAAGNMCNFCRVKPKLNGHPYCGRTCAGKAKATAAAPSSETFTIPNGQKVTIREYNGDFIRDINGPKQITIYRGPGSSHGPNEIIIPRINTKSNTFVDVPHFRVKVDQNTFKWASLRDLIAAGYRGAPFNESLASSSARTTTATTGGIAAVKIITFYEDSDKNTYIFTNYFDKNPLFIGDETGPGAGKKPWKTTEHYFQVYKFLHSNANVDALYTEAQGKETGNQWRDKIGPSWAKAITNRDRSKGPLGDTGTDGNTVSIDDSYWHGGRGNHCEPGKLRAMYNAVKMKFTDNVDLRQKLINTGNAILVENAGGNDKYWGDGSFKIPGGGTNWNLTNIGDKNGENRLGLLLMQIRDEFTGQTTCPAGRDSKVNTTTDPSYDSSTGYFNLNHWPC